MKEKIFENTKGETFTFNEVIETIKTFIEADDSYKYNLMVGCDSQRMGKITRFVTVVIIHRVGKASRIFFVREKIQQELPVHSRLFQETMESVELVRALDESDILYLVDSAEVHIDAGGSQKTEGVLRDSIGYVSSLGFDAIPKPESFAAYTVADHLVRSRHLARRDRKRRQKHDRKLKAI